MAGPHIDESPSATGRERWLAAAGLVLLVLFRSAVFVLWEHSDFDSDQAITGLMAKHLSEGRAFPVFYYGQAYMLAVEAWLAAPGFLIAGVSVMALKLPLVAVNVAIALLLFGILERDVGLRPALAAVPALFVALPAPGTAALLLRANGGNVEPLLYALLLWMLRDRPNWAGLVLGVGFMQREFTVYGLLALLAIEAMRRTLFTRDGLRLRLRMLRTAAEVWLVIQWAKHFSSALGPGSTWAQLRGARDNIVGLTQRFCPDLQALPAGVGALVTDHWPVLFGVRRQPLADFGIESPTAQGMPFGAVLLALALLVPVAGIALRVARDRGWARQYDACAYMVLVGLFSAAGYVVGRCGQVSYLVLRYELLSLIAAAGIAAWWLRLSPPIAAARAWIAAVAACVALSAVAHGLLLARYVTSPPLAPKQVILGQLEARGIQYATSDYWLAYALTFLTDERVIVASEDLHRIEEYQRLVDVHRTEAIRISRQSWCPGARPIPQAGVYFCPPEK